jgi:hypothetical protein
VSECDEDRIEKSLQKSHYHGENILSRIGLRRDVLESRNGSDDCEPNTLVLSASSLASIPQSKQEMDSTFLLGDYCTGCPWLIAAFLSPPVGSAHMSDPTINTFNLETGDLHNPFSEFLILGRGHRLTVTKPNRSVLRSIAYELEKIKVSLLRNDLFDDEITAPAS